MQPIHYTRSEESANIYTDQSRVNIGAFSLGIERRGSNVGRASRGERLERAVPLIRATRYRDSCAAAPRVCAYIYLCASIRRDIVYLACLYPTYLLTYLPTYPTQSRAR